MGDHIDSFVVEQVDFLDERQQRVLDKLKKRVNVEKSAKTPTSPQCAWDFDANHKDIPTD